jgi:hypothetical protein
LFFLENWGFGINTRFQYLKPCFYTSCWFYQCTNLWVKQGPKVGFLCR